MAGGFFAALVPFLCGVLGAIIANEFARQAEARGRAPVHLLVSGQLAPHQRMQVFGTEGKSAASN